MPIGNKKTWDNGIGAGPTNVIFGQQQQQSPWQQQASQQNNNWAQGPQQPQQTRQATGINRGALNADPNAQQQQQPVQPVQPVQNNIPNAWNTETQGAQWDQNMVDQGFIWTKSAETGKFEWMSPEDLRAIKRKAGHGWQFRPPDGPTGAGGHR